MIQNNIAQQSSLLSRLSDSQLTQELSSPSGMAPQYLVMSEMQKRQQMRSGGGGGAKPPIKQQMLANSAVGPSPTMPEAAAAANVQSPPVPAGPQMVGNNIAPQGGIPALAQMSRVAGSPIARPVGYDQAIPPTYAQGGIVGAMRFAGGGPTDDGDLSYFNSNSDDIYGDGGGGVTPIDQATIRGRRPAVVLPTSETPVIPKSAVAIPGSSDLDPAFTKGYAPVDGGQAMPSAVANLQFQQAARDSILGNMGVRMPSSINENYGSTYNDILGGDKAFSQAYDPAIQMYRQQAASQNPISTALMKAGAAMMSAPNGTLLSGLGVGLNSGVDAYSQAQAQQRAIQDKLVQAQMGQGNAVVAGRVHGLADAMQLGSQQQSAYQSAAQQATQMAGNAAQVPYTAGKMASESADSQANRDNALALANLRIGADRSNLAQQQQFSIPKIVEDHRNQIIADYTSRTLPVLLKQIDPMLPPEDRAKAEQQAIQTITEQARKVANGSARSLLNGYGVPQYYANGIRNPMWQSYDDPSK